MKHETGAVTWTAMGRLTAPLLIMGVSLWALTGLLDSGLLASLPGAIAALPASGLVIAAGWCAISLWAVAAYDGLAHRHFQTNTDARLARRSGFAAIAIAQTVGFGIVSGATVRWRMLPHLGLAGAMRLSVFVSITFIAALAFLTALACLILPAPGWTTLPALVLVSGVPATIAALGFAPACAGLRHRAHIPSLRAISSILGWAGLDLVAAALALFVLIPAPELTFAVFLPVFLLALGAAMLSGAPGGVGPFELTLIGLLPQVAPSDLIAAIVVFRGLYYACPAVLAVVCVFAPRRPVFQQDRREPVQTDHRLSAEQGILAQNGGRLLDHGTGSLALWTTTQTATMLFDPTPGTARDALTRIEAEARGRARTACVYKCGPRTALAARARGWAVVRIAQDCVIDLRAYDLADSRRSGLRRKLRKAEKAGVRVSRATSLPLDAMAAIDSAWQDAHGTARGGTMGRFCARYLATQDVYLAFLHDRLVAFVSFHRDAHAPCLDLVRHLPEVPDGTMHLLIQCAIEASRADNKAHLSLAAVPCPPAWTRRLGRLSRRFDNPGLRQFKAAFAPRYTPRYAAAPTPIALSIALADIASEVHRPRPIGTGSAGHTLPPHDQDEEYEVALTA